MAISKVQSQAETREILAQMDTLKKRAARQALKDTRDQTDIPTVEVTILPMGDGQVSMGEHFGGIGDAHYEAGEKATLLLPVAIALFDRGFVNFEGAKEASEEARKARMAQARQRAEAMRRAQEEAEAAEYAQ
jgi:hypothetical protein